MFFIALSAVIASIAGLARGQSSYEDPRLNLIFVGTFEFEVMGNPHRLYICGSGEDDDTELYWSVEDRHSSKSPYALALGRDSDGLEYLGEQVWTIRSDIFKLHGDQILQGYYEIVFDRKTMTFLLKERFPEFEDGQSDDEIWNEYELTKISGAVVGNPDLEGHQCFHPQGNNAEYQLLGERASLWKSDFQVLDDGFFYNFIEDDARTSCWKLDNEYGDTMRAGWTYDLLNVEWDGGLLMTRFDSVNGEEGCKVGSAFLVIVDEGLAVMSKQCEDTRTGHTMLMHLQEKKGSLECPFEVTPYSY